MTATLSFHPSMPLTVACATPSFGPSMPLMTPYTLDRPSWGSEVQIEAVLAKTRITLTLTLTLLQTQVLPDPNPDTITEFDSRIGHCKFV